jgi:hypothetical protein
LYDIKLFQYSIGATQKNNLARNQRFKAELLGAPTKHRGHPLTGLFLKAC